MFVIIYYSRCVSQLLIIMAIKSKLHWNSKHACIKVSLNLHVVCILVKYMHLYNIIQRFLMTKNTKELVDINGTLWMLMTNITVGLLHTSQEIRLITYILINTLTINDHVNIYTAACIMSPLLNAYD